jgi:beta-glucosidase
MKNVAGPGVTILYEKGANITDDTLLAKKANVFGERVDVDSRAPQEMIDAAVAIANRADKIVAVVGEASEMSGEAASRSDIGLPQSQVDLLQALAKTGKPLIVVVLSGRPLTLSWVNENENIHSILQAWFGGHEAGNAFADVLFGNYNPSGKLTMTFPRNVGQIPIYYNHKNTGRPAAAEFQKFQSNYLDVPNDPLFPFGYGLSYTHFSYDDKITLSSQTMTANQTITASVTIANTGDFPGEEVVQLYIYDPVASIAQPVKKLKDFQKVFLKTSESRVVSFTIDINDLKFYNKDLKYVAEPGEFKVYIGGNSRDVKEARFTLK